MLRKILSLSALVLVAASFGQINSNSPTKPFGSNSSYANGIMPANLPSSGAYGASSAAGSAYQSWVSNFVRDCSGGSKRVLFDDNSSTVSEGIAYGMLLSAYAGDKPTFDGLWKYYKDNMNGNGVMNWKLTGCTGTVGFGGATDAELDAAMALIVAKEQWPTATTPYNYGNEATTLIGKIKQYEIHPTTKQAINGDGWGFGNNCRNPSYASPAYYREYAKFVSSQNQFWTETATAADSYLMSNRNGTTGLVSDWSGTDAVPNTCQDGSSLHFGFEAARNPWRMATDYLWNGNNAATAKDICTKLSNWAKNDASNLKGPVSLNAGSPGAGTYKNGTFSTFALAFMVNSSFQNALNSAYSSTVGLGNSEGYFSNTLRCITLFQLTGNFWQPGASTPTNNAPTVSLTSPSSNLATCLGTKFNLTADARDSDGTISKVEFYEGVNLIKTITVAPFSFQVTNATSGQKSYTAKAFDNGALARTSTAVTVNVSNVTSPDGTTCSISTTSGDWHSFIDDFDATTEVKVANSTTAITWWVAPESAASHKITRTATDMKVTLTKANEKLLTGKGSYKVFGLNFGVGNYINLNELSNANINLNITNNTDTEVKLAIQLKDVNGVSAEIVPEDVAGISWNNQWEKIGPTIAKGQTFNGVIDLSTRANELGGLTALSYGCATPDVCPSTAYTLDASKIKEIVFIVNGGAAVDNMLVPPTGDLVFNYLSIGETAKSSAKIIKSGAVEPIVDADNDGVPDYIDNCLNSLPGEKVDAKGCKANGTEDLLSQSIAVYPNPAKDELNVSQASYIMDEVSLVNVSGLTVKTFNLTSSNQSLSLQGVDKGVYVLILKGQTHTVQKRIVVE
jgi:endo-1,4-beta-D-glucanase Y